MKGSEQASKLASSDSKKVMELALRAGHILLENGAEIFRVEETMNRICHYYGLRSGNTFVVGNGIIVTAGSEQESFYAKVQNIAVSGNHLDKIAAVNQLSREIEQGLHTVEGAQKELDRICTLQENGKGLQIIASGLSSAAFCYLFGGGLVDCVIALFSGLLLYVYVLYISIHLSKIVGNILGGALATVFCRSIYLLGIGEQLNAMITGSMMVLTPGVAFTNAIREMANADYISGTVRMMDALVSFISIALGVGLGTALIGGFR